jgi:hypothetical protein
MKTSILIFAISFLQANLALAANFKYDCRNIEDGNDSNEITVTLKGESAVLTNFWGSGVEDKGDLKKIKPNGDMIFKGFANWVDDGVEGSGYMIIGSELIKGKHGKIVLYNKYCEENCTDRSARLDCTKTK